MSGTVNQKQPQVYTPSLPPRLPADLGTYVQRELQAISIVLARMAARIEKLENP